MTSSTSNIQSPPSNTPKLLSILGAIAGLIIQILAGIYASTFLVLLSILFLIVALAGIISIYVSGSRRIQVGAFAFVLFLMGLSLAGGLFLAGWNRGESPEVSSNQMNLFERAENWDVFESNETFNIGAPVDTGSVRLPIPNSNHGSGYSVQIKPDVTLNYDIVYNQDIGKVDVITADVYIANDERLDYRRQWVAIQMMTNNGWSGSGSTIELGKWTRLTLDLRSQYDNDGVRFNMLSGTLRVVYSLVGKSGSSVGNVMVGLDNVFSYQKSGDLSTNEQVASNQLLFGFENRSTQGWQIGKDRDGIDTLSSTSSPTYRGGWALELQTNGVHEYDAASAKIKIPQFSAYGIWIAHVFIPVNTSVELWANMFTYLEEGDNFAAAEPTLLRNGSWTTLIWDTRKLPTMTSDALIGIEVGTTKGTYQGSIYIDDVEVYQK